MAKNRLHSDSFQFINDIIEKKMIVVTGSCTLKVQGKSKQTKVKAKAMGHPGDPCL